MSKRKSIGNDPLDWIGERSASGGGDSPDGQAELRYTSGTVAGAEPVPGGLSGAPAQAVVPLAAPSNSLQLERQLLLVDGMLREGSSRPRLNQLLWALLFTLVFLGAGIILFKETRRHWGERVAALEGSLERMEKEHGRNERILEQVISQKDQLIWEKQGTIQKIEALHQGAIEELTLARAESRRLQSENRSLVERLLDQGEAWLEVGGPPEEAKSGPAGGAASPGTGPRNSVHPDGVHPDGVHPDGLERPEKPPSAPAPGQQDRGGETGRVK